MNGWYIEFDTSTTDILTFEYTDEIKINSPTAYLKGIFFCRDGYEINVDTEFETNNTVGQHVVTHHASVLFLNSSITTYFNIVDTKDPQLELKYIEEYYTVPGKEYKEEGYLAYDEYDGDITDRVKSYILDGVVNYSVSDSSGNTVTKTREIVYKDVTAPVITLLGNQVIILKQGETFNEPGYYAIDDCDGDLTSQVIVNADFNTGTPGQYTIEYSIRDKYNNLDVKTRTIIVEELISTEIIEKEELEETPEIIEPEITKEPSEPEPPEQPVITENTKVIYLTFDDGPSKHTTKLLEVLKEHDVKATFFVVGSSYYKDLIDDIYNDGHAIGIHTYTHEYKDIYANEEAYFADLEKTKDLIYEYTGEYTNLVRFPGGSSNSVSKSYNTGIMTRLASMLEEKGYAYFDWNVSSGDAGGASTTEEVVSNVINGIKNKKQVIVLQHDTKKFSVEAVEEIILWGKENGYIFMPLTTDSITCHHKIQN